MPVRKVSEAKFKFNFMVYGDSGVGKTLLSGSAFDVPELNPMLFISVEGGEYTLRKSYSEIDVVRVNSWAELQGVYEDLKSTNYYRSAVIDSLTEVQKIGMSYTMQRRRGDDDMAIPEIKDWGINIEQTRNFVRKVRDLEGVSTIFTALAKSDTDKRTGLTRKKPYLDGKLADEVAGFLDIVTYLYVEEVNKVNKRILLTETMPGFVAKDRSALLPAQIVNPTMPIIFNYLTGKVTENNDVQA